MVPCVRSGAARFLAACALAAFILVAGIAPAAVEEKKSCALSFALPEGVVLHYKVFAQTEQNYHGTTVTMNQSLETELKHSGATEEGYTKVVLKFDKLTSSLVSNNQLMDWEPPIKLEGRSVRASISRKGEIVDAEPLGSIPGLSSAKQLPEIIEPWFVVLPDTVVAVGGTWKREIIRGKRESGEPEMKGEGLYTLKKIEKKGGIEVAVIEGKISAKLNKETPAGMLVANSKIEVKAQVAIVGGYAVELKRSIEIKGHTIERDELTNKETKRETMITSFYESKLLK